MILVCFNYYHDPYIGGQHFTILLCVYFSDLVNLCTVDGNTGDGNAQGDCLSTDEVCNADGTCTLAGMI